VANKPKPRKSPLSAKDAAARAAAYLVEILGDVREVTLEETELSEDDRYWFITLRYTRPEHPSPFGPLYEHKVLKVNATSGQVRSMKMRTV